MREASIGRVLPASLHQGIADVLPARLGFYESWLSPEGLREGTIGIPPFHAVLSFLRHEGEAYQTIMTRAGEYAADWTLDSMSPVRKAWWKASPRWLRRRLVLKLEREFVRATYRGSRMISKIRKGTVSIDLSKSIFCTVREPAPAPLCGFYVASLARFLKVFNVEGRPEVVTCRGAGGATCILGVPFVNRAETESAAP